jgi:hypothetical protein
MATKDEVLHAIDAFRAEHRNDLTRLHERLDETRDAQHALAIQHERLCGRVTVLERRGPGSSGIHRTGLWAVLGSVSLSQLAAFGAGVGGTILIGLALYLGLL